MVWEGLLFFHDFASWCVTHGNTSCHLTIILGCMPLMFYSTRWIGFFKLGFVIAGTKVLGSLQDVKSEENAIQTWKAKWASKVSLRNSSPNAVRLVTRTRDGPLSENKSMTGWGEKKPQMKTEENERTPNVSLRNSSQNLCTYKCVVTQGPCFA